MIKIKTNKEKTFNKTMTKHIQNLNSIFWTLRQWWKSKIKAPANFCDDEMKFIEALITSLFSSRL